MDGTQIAYQARYEAGRALRVEPPFSISESKLKEDTMFDWMLPEKHPIVVDGTIGSVRD